MKTMKGWLPVLLIVGVVGLLALTALQSQSQEKTGVVRHVVCFSFKEDATPEQIQKVVDAFAELPKKISTITGFECGTNMSPEKLNKGFTHCFILTFKNEKDRDEYLPHPAHKAFGQSLGPIVKDVFVIDFKTE